MSEHEPAVQRLLRDLAAPALAATLRRYRDFAGSEDAVQEALIAAAAQWPKEGVPERPLAWLVHVAGRRVTDQMRAEAARRHRERLVVSLIPADEQIGYLTDGSANERDDTLALFFSCCHPALTPSSQVALTLRAVGGLTSAEIARAFMVPEATMAQRLSRAKSAIRGSGAGFALPTGDAWRERLGTVLSVLYLIFNEGYAATSGPYVHRVDLADEAIRVCKLLARTVPDEPEVKGLLALLLLSDARRAARSGPNGELIPLDEQDRSLWDRDEIAQGEALLEDAMQRGTVGPYQIQAAVAALHDQASCTETTDWKQILALYDLLVRLGDNPMARLSHAIALAMVEGPRAGLVAIDELAADPRVSRSHRVDAARAHLFERLGDRPEAIALYRRAAQNTTSLAERNYLLLRAARLADRDA